MTKIQIIEAVGTATMSALELSDDVWAMLEAIDAELTSAGIINDTEVAR